MRRLGYDPALEQAVDQIMRQYIALHNKIERLWMDKMVFTWHWWADAALAVLPWILWFIVRDRKNTHNLMYAGLFSMLAATLLDMVGIKQGGWKYNTWFLPFLTEFLPWDLSVMPVTAMLFYQFIPKINPWIKGAVFGAIAAYIVEPVFIWLGFYEPINWELHYSLPIYFAIYMIGHWLYTRKRVEQGDAA